MDIKSFKLKVTSDGIEIDNNISMPNNKYNKRQDLDYEKYDNLRSLGWSDEEIIKMLERSKERGRTSDSGLVYI